MKKIAIILSVITSCYTLSACSPIIIVGATAGAGATIATDRRSTGKMVEDQAIEMQASDFIYANEEFGKKVHVSVASVNNIVLLTGEVPDARYRQIIYDKVMRMRPVKDVINKIEVRSNLSLEDRSNDAWVTGKIKARILAKKGLLSRTKVVTANNHVYLMGMVNNQEAKEILAIIDEMGGIKNVTPLYEAYRGGQLQENLTAQAQKSQNPANINNNSNVTKTNTKKKTQEEILDDEDSITVQPYVIQPPIVLSNDE